MRICQAISLYWAGIARGGGEKAANKGELIQCSKADIICLCEAHLIKSNVIDIEGYVFMGNSRSTLHKRAKVRSGGVAVLVKNSLI